LTRERRGKNFRKSCHVFSRLLLKRIVMKARFIFYAGMLILAVLLGVLVNYCVPEPPASSGPLTAADLQEFRASVTRRSASPVGTPGITNAASDPRSAGRETVAAG